jgi:hypothetical protein
MNPLSRWPGRTQGFDEPAVNPGPNASVLPRATAGVKRLRISVSTIAAGAETIPIAVPHARRVIQSGPTPP